VRNSATSEEFKAASFLWSANYVNDQKLIQASIQWRIRRLIFELIFWKVPVAFSACLHALLTIWSAFVTLYTPNPGARSDVRTFSLKFDSINRSSDWDLEHSQDLRAHNPSCSSYLGIQKPRQALPATNSTGGEIVLR
jgi:hypothetical protein